MRMEDVLLRVRSCGVLAVVRDIEPEALGAAVEALVQGGVDCIEIAMSIRGALREMTLLKQRFEDRAILGAGEVLNGEMVSLAATAQADFCCGIGANAEMVRTCISRDILPIPGAFTPTEIQAAWHAGAAVVKLFPAQLLSPEYIQIMRRTLYRVELMPSGGISSHNAADFVRAGAFAVAAGRGIVAESAAKAGDWAVITHNAAAVREAVLAARQ